MGRDRQVKFYITGDSKSAEAAAHKVGGALGGLEGVVGKLTGKLGGLPPQLQGVVGGLGKLGPEGAAAAAGLGLAVAGIAKAAEADIAWANTVRGLKGITGASAEDASRLAVVMQHLGMNVDDAQKPFSILSKKLYEGDEKLKSWFSSTELATLKSQDLAASIPLLQQKFQSLHDPIARNAFVMEVFGKGGAVLKKLLAENADEFKRFSAEAENMGLVMSQKDLDAARDLQVEMRGLGLQMKGVEVRVGKGVVPVLSDLATVFTKATNSANDHQSAIGKAISQSKAAAIWRSATDTLHWLAGAHRDTAKAAGEHQVSEEESAAAVAAAAKENAAAATSLYTAWNKAGDEIEKRAAGFVPKFGETFQQIQDLSVSKLEETSRDSVTVLTRWNADMAIVGEKFKKNAPDMAGPIMARLQELGPAALPLLDELKNVTAGKFKEIAGLMGEQITQGKAAADQQWDKFPANFSQKMEAARQSVVGGLSKLVTDFTQWHGSEEMSAKIAGDMRAAGLQIEQLASSGNLSMTALQQSLLDTALTTKNGPEAEFEAMKNLVDSLNGKTISILVQAQAVGDHVGPNGQPINPGFYGPAKGGSTVNVNVAGSVISDQQLLDRVTRGLSDHLARNGRTSLPAAK